MTAPTLTDLVAQRAALDKQIAEQEAAPLKEIFDLLTSASSGELVTGLTAAREQLLPGSLGHEHVGNLIKVFAAVATIVKTEIDRVVAAPVEPLTVAPVEPIALAAPIALPPATPAP